MKGKVINIEFSFKGQLISAIVFIKEAGYDLAARVCYCNAGVRQFLPGGEARFSLLNGIEMPHGYTHDAALLIIRTSEAISRFLQKA